MSSTAAPPNTSDAACPASNEAQAAKQDSERAFAALADCVPQMVWMCRPDGLNVCFNRRSVEYTGLPVEEGYRRPADSLGKPAQSN
jgi:PAS domain-containing protein